MVILFPWKPSEITLSSVLQMVSHSKGTRSIVLVYFLFQFCSLVLLNSSCEQMLFLIDHIISFSPYLLSQRSFLAWQCIKYFFTVRNVPFLSSLCCTSELCFHLSQCPVLVKRVCFFGLLKVLLNIVCMFLTCLQIKWNLTFSYFVIEQILEVFS